MSDINVADAEPAQHDASYQSNWSKLRAAEEAAIAERWKHAYPDKEQTPATPRIGLALSGGGIRSATFCIGLMRGLAQNKVLRRFDYLSTVSGGGYAGSAFGRLVATLGIDKAEETLAAGDSIVLTWLRRYGRYLTPAGARDFGMLIATYLRAAIAVHFEIGLLAMLIGLLVTAPHAILPGMVALDVASWQPWRTFWWPIAILLWLAVGPALMITYWNARPKRDAPTAATVWNGFGWIPVLVLSAVTGALLAWATPASVAYLRSSVHGVPPLAVPIAIATAGVIVALLRLVIRAVANRKQVIAEFVAERRNGLTRALRFINKMVLVLALLGLLDFACCSLLELIRAHRASGGSGNWLVGGLGGGALFAILLRAFAEPLQKLANAPDSAAARWMPRLINFAGLGVGVLLLGAWTFLVQWLVFNEDSWSLLNDLTPVQRIGLLVGVIVAWLWMTARNRDTVNESSLHSFYRARLIRAYLSVGSRKRFDLSAQGMAHGSKKIEVMPSVTDYMSGDDIALRDYRPEANGGPIHLVCACINQTVDDSSELFNADRKGAAIIASARGIEVGLDDPVLARGNMQLGSLGHWVATSGAAAAPGAGSNTTSGWALLLFMVGARLGFWLDSRSIEANTVLRPSLASWLRETKSGLLLTEALAWFGGRARDWWFLSDGGHFDNTGVYALLRRELDCIVLADCGADPKFEFADLEHLVRKARIDFDADIEFYTRREVAGLFPPSDAHLQVLALEDMKDNTSARGVLLARICYHSSDPCRRKVGSLLVVKPNLHEVLDRDLLAYAARNPTFPQQSTGDQFFDEAQWESYHRLGHDFGRAMTSTWLRHVPGWRVAVECPIPLLPLRRISLLAAASTADALPFWRRGVAATALGTGIGLGALGTVLLSGWQVIESIQTRQRDEMTRVRTSKDDALKLMGEIEPAVTRARNALGACRQDQEPTAGSCADPTSYDLTPFESGKLEQIYETKRQLEKSVRNDTINSLIAEVQLACGVTGGICGADVALAPNMCRRTCETPRVESNYWVPPALGSDWIRNPVVAWTVSVAQSLFAENFMARGELASNDTSTAMPAPPPTIDSSASTAPPPVTLPEAVAHPHVGDDRWLGQQSRNDAGHDASGRRKPGTSYDNPSIAATIGQATRTDKLNPENISETVATAAKPFPSCNLAGKPVTIYVQIFDDSLRPELVQLGNRWFGGDSRNDDVVVAGVENVVDTALRRGTTPPRSYRTPTMIVHDERDKACATAIGTALQADFDAIYGSVDDGYISIRELPKSLATATPRHAIELWLPTPSNLAQ